MRNFFTTNMLFASLTILVLALTGCTGSGKGAPQSLYITPTTTYTELCNAVDKAMGYNSLERLAFDLYADHLDLERRMKCGHYRLDPAQSIITTVRHLALGNQTPVRLVVGEARTLPQLAGKLSKQLAADSLALINAFNDKQLRRELGYVKDSLIAMFIPNTYEVYWTTSPEALLRRMKRESDAFWNEARHRSLAQRGLTRYEAMTLASIVYEETKQRDEMPRIAGVYLNRLRKGMALQACPTVKFAMGDFALQRILHKHLRYRSPYNTYINKGLPPGPICIPSITAIDAVLNAERSDYLYFCARPEFDGKHNFARTLREHNRNAEQYAKALKKLGK